MAIKRKTNDWLVQYKYLTCHTPLKTCHLCCEEPDWVNKSAESTLEFTEMVVMDTMRTTVKLMKKMLSLQSLCGANHINIMTTTKREAMNERADISTIGMRLQPQPRWQKPYRFIRRGSVLWLFLLVVKRPSVSVCPRLDPVSILFQSAGVLLMTMGSGLLILGHGNIFVCSPHTMKQFFFLHSQLS